MHNKIRKSPPLYEQFYFFLKDKIMLGEFSPGTRLIDTQLATEFGTSRSPIREALRMLEMDGLIVNNNGILKVYEPSLNDVLDLYKVRAGLEYSATYIVTQKQDIKVINGLEKCISLTNSALIEKNYEEVVKQNTIFHDLIMNGSNNQRLISMMNQIRSLILLYRKILFLKFDEDYDFLTDHSLVLEAIKAGSAEAAGSTMVKHINNDMKYFEKLFMKRGEI